MGTRMRNWTVFVTTFLIAWLILIVNCGCASTVRAHWPVTLVMTLGSVVAGSTPMGGGSVAFPILVLAFKRSPASARDFAFLIQSVGMTSALLFMIGRKVWLPGRLLAGSAFGSALGLISGTLWFAPHLPESNVKLLFSCFWLSFAMLTMARHMEISSLQGRVPAGGTGWIGFAAGLIGGAIASIVGIGVEMTIYAVMVLVFRSDLRTAIAAAVSAGALASIEGAALHGIIADIRAETVYDWIAAAPVVIFGAPIGARLVTILPRGKLLYAVSGLCVLQFLWTFRQTVHSGAEWRFVGIAMLAEVSVLLSLYQFGRRLTPQYNRRQLQEGT